MSLPGSDITVGEQPASSSHPQVPRNYQVVDAATALGVPGRPENRHRPRWRYGHARPEHLHANADSFGDDGVIDLIETLGNFGLPLHHHRPQSNVRYIDVNWHPLPR